MEKFVKTKEVCELFDLNKQTITNLIKDKKIPYYKVGGQYRFKISELEEFFKVKRNDTHTEIKE